jgi:hypothetical protein
MVKSLLVALAILTGCTYEDPNATYIPQEYIEVHKAEFKVYTDFDVCWHATASARVGEYRNKEITLRECGYGDYEFPEVVESYYASVGSYPYLCEYLSNPTSSPAEFKLQFFVNDELVDEDIKFLSCFSRENLYVGFSNP